MDRLTALKVFSEVANSGSFTATADKLDMSRAMVTRYVEDLESWLGARLLQRTTRRVTLTDAGERCLSHGQQMLSLMEDMLEETVWPEGQLRGQLRLTCSLSFAYAQLAAALTEFMHIHPGLKVDLNVSDGALNLVDARMDLAIRISSDPDPMLISRPLAACHSVLVATPAYLAGAGIPQVPEDLMQHRCLSHSSFGKSAWIFQRAGQSEEIPVVSYLTVNDATTLMQAALADGGIVMLPVYLVNSAIRDGQLTTVLEDWKLPAFTICALYPSRRHLSPAVRSLLDFLVQRFASLNW